VRYTEADSEVAEGRLPILIVTLACPGFTVRSAERPVSIEYDDLDAIYQYDGTLIRCDGFEPEVDVFGLERAEISRARIALTLPEDLTPASLEMTRHYLTASKVEVAQVWSGQDWKDRRIWIGGGTVNNLKLGVSGQPIEFVAEAIPQVAGAIIGDPTRDMAAVGQQIGYTSISGKPFPVVIGRCYRLPGYKTNNEAGSGLENGIIIAGHHFAVTTTPDVYEDGDSTPYAPAGTLTVENDEDTEGDPMCGISSDNAADFAVSDGAFTFDAPYGGIQASRDTGAKKAAVGADGVLTYILTESLVAVDWRRMQAALERLSTWEIGVYVDKPTEGLKLIRERILPALPLIEEQSSEGLWYRYVDVANDPSELDLILGNNLVGRITDLEQVTDPDDIRNTVTVYYFYDHGLGEYLESVTVDSSNNVLCAISEGLFGTRADSPIKCNITWDAPTAERIAHHRMNRLSLHRFAVTYVIDASLYWLEEGTIVRVTDSDLGLSARRCVVRKVNAKLNPPRITVETVPGGATAYGV
jgi:hypothetical protein